MSDQGFREIQLSGKQLVFLFMATVVVAVTVFLLGVSVGRGVRQATAPELEASADATSAPIAPAAVDVPPPTEMTPADTRYAQLDRSGGGSVGGPDATPASATSADATPVDETVPEKAAGAEAKPGAANLKPAADPKTAATAPAPAAVPPAAVKASDNNDLPRTAANGQWVVQINAYRSRESADREVATLKKKGYAAFILSGGTSFYRVRVGPFRERSDADRTAARLTKEGFAPLVTR